MNGPVKEFDYLIGMNMKNEVLKKEAFNEIKEFCKQKYCFPVLIEFNQDGTVVITPSVPALACLA